MNHLRILFSGQAMKAWMAGVIAAAGAFGIALQDNAVTTPEIIGIILAALTSIGGVYGVQNDTTDAQKALLRSRYIQGYKMGIGAAAVEAWVASRPGQGAGQNDETPEGA